MQKLPNAVQHYKSTPTFTNRTVPESLLSEHNTKAGVWGLLNVESGTLKYVITEQGREEEFVLNAGETAVIAPEEKHFVEPQGEVAFHVAFHR